MDLVLGIGSEGGWEGRGAKGGGDEPCFWPLCRSASSLPYSPWTYGAIRVLI